MRSPRAERERGSVMILTGLCLVILVGIAAFVVDAGNGLQRRRAAYTASDAGAIAGAYELLTGGHDATARHYVDLNDFDGTDADVNVPPTSGSRQGDRNCLEVIARDTVATFFGGVIGVDSLSVAGRAVACVTAGGRGALAGQWALFAASTSCNREGFLVSGSGQRILGRAHTNNGGQISGSDNSFSGSVTHVGDLQVSGGNNGLTPPPVAGLVMPFPVTWDIGDFRPGGARANAAAAVGKYHDYGNSKIDFNSSADVIPEGLYFTRGDVKISGQGLVTEGRGATFVSDGGTIHIAASGGVYKPYEPDGLFAFTTRGGCNNDVITLSGSGVGLNGISYAPNGRVQWSGSGNATTVTGGLWGATVKLNGSLEFIRSGRAGGAPWADGAPVVELIE